MALARAFSRALAVLAFGITPIGAADIDTGRELAKKCSVCHGKLGLANDPEVPNLAGQSAFYLEKAMKDYRSGARQDRRMSILAADLDDQQIADLSAWFASLEISVRAPQ